MIDLCNAVDRYFDLDALFCHSDHLAYAANAYHDGRLKNHKIFRELVERHAHDAEYRYYKDLVLQIDGITLPERKAHIDYERLKQEREQDYFDVLFNRAKAEELLLLSIQKSRMPDPTVKELIHSARKYEYGSLLMELNYGLHRHVQESEKAKNALQTLDWNRFVIFETHLSIQNVKTIQVSDEQKSALREMLSLLYGQGLLENAVTYRDTSAQVPIFVIAAVSLSVYLGLVPEENDGASILLFLPKRGRTKIYFFRVAYFQGAASAPYYGKREGAKSSRAGVTRSYSILRRTRLRGHSGSRC